MNTAFCQKCGRMTEYTIDKWPTRITVNGISFVYSESTALCTVCGKEVYAPKVNDANVEARGAAYHRAMERIESDG